MDNSRLVCIQSGYKGHTPCSLQYHCHSGGVVTNVHCIDNNSNAATIWEFCAPLPSMITQTFARSPIHISIHTILHFQVLLWPGSHLCFFFLFLVLQKCNTVHFTWFSMGQVYYLCVFSHCVFEKSQGLFKI